LQQQRVVWVVEVANQRHLRTAPGWWLKPLVVSGAPTFPSACYHTARLPVSRTQTAAGWRVSIRYAAHLLRIPRDNDKFKQFPQFHAVCQLTEYTVLSLSDKSRVSHLAAYFRTVVKVLCQCSVAMEKSLEHRVFPYGNCANSFPTGSVVLFFKPKSLDAPLPITKHSLCLAMTLGCTSVGTWDLRTAGAGPQKIPCYSTECHYMILKLVWSATSASEMVGAVFWDPQFTSVRCTYPDTSRI
jgi:hypothetical protein